MTDTHNRPPLSPAAQMVLDAFENASDGEYVEGVWVVNERTMLATALRAAADQVVPDYCLEHQLNDSEWQNGFTDANCRVRANLLAIAMELEAHQ